MVDNTAGCMSVRDHALRAKEASRMLATSTTDERNSALSNMAQALRQASLHILAANARDMESARAKGTPDPLLDRLMLDESRIEAMARAIESLRELPDPLGRVLEHRTIPSGVDLERITVPLGVVAMVYEARPNVTADAASICIKTGNACVLRGGSLAFNSCSAIASVLSDAVVSVGFPEGSIEMVSSPDRAATDELLAMRGLIDVLIPRGGTGLIRHCVDNARVPVIETGTGNCHVYVEQTADQYMALSIIENAKTSRPGVCNACESVLVDSAIADEFLPKLVAMLVSDSVRIHGDERTLAAAQEISAPRDMVVLATDEDWGREYLDLEISVKVVSGPGEAIAHINTYGTGHSEAIVSADKDICECFLTRVDAAAVYANASTRFTDGGEFGLGAEIGISTQKLHARGPFALEALTSYKYVLRGTGQIR